MTTRNRPIVRTPRKRRIWITAQLGIGTGTAGVAGQVRSTALADNLKARLDRDLYEVTLAHTWVRGFWTQLAAGDSTSFQGFLGIGMYPPTMDLTDYPDLSVHAGNWQLHDARELLEGGAVNSVCVPSELATVDIESQGQRTAKGEEEPVMVVQLGAATPSQSVFLNGEVTALFLV